MNKKTFNRHEISIITVIVSVLLIVVFAYSISLCNVSGSAYNNEPFSTMMEPIQTTKKNSIEEKEQEQEPMVSTDTTSSELELLALVTMAEAEGESEDGQRLVIDTILNRVDHPRFPNTIEDVIYEPNQFTSMWNGRVDRSYITDDIRRLVFEEMQKNDYWVGGEQSGHIIFLEHEVTGDGLMTALKILEIMKATGKSLKELSEGLFIYPQLLKNVTVKDKNACLESKELQEVVDAVANDLGNEGRILVRPSGTEPLIRVMVEAKTDELCAQYVKRVTDFLEENNF